MSISHVYAPLAVFFTAIILFDIRLTSGPANAFILYSQVIATTFSLDANGGIPLDQVIANGTFNKSDLLMKIYKFPYDIFNLNFIANYLHPICFSPRIDTPSVLFLEYGVAFFPLILIIITVVVLKLKECCCNRLNITSRGKTVKFINNRMQKVNNALLPAFASFILLSYTKFSTTSSNLMRTVTLNNTKRLHLAGQYDEKTLMYNVYLSFGIAMFSVFVAVTPLLLLDFPLRFIEWIISKSTTLTKIYPSTRIHILLDTFQGCYKKDTRFFAGLYFLCRLVVTLSYVYCETWTERFIIQQLTVTVVVILLALFKPYRTELNFVNYVDILIFSNLAILNCTSFYLYIVYAFNPTESSLRYTAIFILQYTGVFFPLFYIIGYITWYWKKMRATNWEFKRLSTDSEDLDGAIFDRAKKGNEYRQSTQPSACDLHIGPQSDASSSILVWNRKKNSRGSYQSVQLLSAKDCQSGENSVIRSRMM